MTAAGGGSSLRNAGQIVPSFGIPLAPPGYMKQALGYMLKPTGPLRLRASVEPDFLRWLLRFARNSSEEKFRECLREALALGKDTHRLFDELRADGVQFEMHEKGIVFATLSEGALREEIET